MFALELGLTLITIALAVCFPRFACGFFLRLETVLRPLARRRALAVFLIGASACVLRLALLSLSPIPQPYIHDDFSFLLAADTFAHGRLTNPTPAMWMHFESFHITLRPTYMSMYFPGQGMVMAAAQILAGHPWWGIWASCGFMCAAICWMLQGWLPPTWALLGGFLAILRIALFSYWIDSYTGAGALAALGGALVLGAVPRIRHHVRSRDFFWMALGMAILATTRPYEGLLVCIPAVAALAWWRMGRPGLLTKLWPVGDVRGSDAYTGHQHPASGTLQQPLKVVARSVLVRRTAPAAALLVTTVVCMGYYDYRVFGNAFTPPYRVDRETYGVVQHFLWQPLRPEPVYRYRIMRDFYTGTGVGSEMKFFRDETRSAAALLGVGIGKLLVGGFFYFGFALVPPLIMLPWALGDRRIRFLVLSGIVVTAGLAIETFFIQHYLAPATALLYAMLLQCMRHLRVRGAPGLFLVRATPVLCVALAVLRAFALPLHIDLAPELFNSTLLAWCGTSPRGLDRARVLARLESLPGPQLAIVPYSPRHMLNDWVYNSADIDKSKVVWAREMDPASNRKLLRYFKNRKAWLVQPDLQPPRVSPYCENAEQ